MPCRGTVAVMPTADRSPARVVKRRPKDRKAQIARASADAFSALGYHAVGMEDIAAAVGISAAALYRHSSSKYELFRDAVMAARSAVGGLHRIRRRRSRRRRSRRSDCSTRWVAALIDTAIANRTSGGLYRWEGRYLHGDDQAELMDQVKLVNRRLQKPLLRLRPTLTSRDRWTLSRRHPVRHRQHRRPPGAAARPRDPGRAFGSGRGHPGRRAARRARRCPPSTRNPKPAWCRAIRSPAACVAGAVHRARVPRDQHGGHRRRGRYARLGHLPPLRRQGRHVGRVVPPGCRQGLSGDLPMCCGRTGSGSGDDPARSPRMWPGPSMIPNWPISTTPIGSTCLPTIRWSCAGSSARRSRRGCGC